MYSGVGGRQLFLIISTGGIISSKQWVNQRGQKFSQNPRTNKWSLRFKPTMYLIPNSVFLITALSWTSFKRSLFKYNSHKMGHLLNEHLSKHYDIKYSSKCPCSKRKWTIWYSPGLPELSSQGWSHIPRTKTKICPKIYVSLEFESWRGHCPKMWLWASYSSCMKWWS